MSRAQAYLDGLEAAAKIAEARLAGESGQGEREFGYRLAAFTIANDIRSFKQHAPPYGAPETEEAKVARRAARAAGGHARAAALTPEQRSAQARKAAQARWQDKNIIETILKAV